MATPPRTSERRAAFGVAVRTRIRLFSDSAPVRSSCWFARVVVGRNFFQPTPRAHLEQCFDLYCELEGWQPIRAHQARNDCRLALELASQILLRPSLAGHRLEHVAAAGREASGTCGHGQTRTCPRVILSNGKIPDGLPSPGLAKAKHAKPTGILEIDTFGSQLARILEVRGWTPTDLARATERTGFGRVALPSITRVLNRQRSIELKTLLRLAVALEMSLDTLLDFDVRALDEQSRVRTLPRRRGA